MNFNLEIGFQTNSIIEIQFYSIACNNKYTQYVIVWALGADW